MASFECNSKMHEFDEYDDPYRVYTQALKAHNRRDYKAIVQSVASFRDKRERRKQDVRRNTIDVMKRSLQRLESNVLESYLDYLKSKLKRLEIVQILLAAFMSGCFTMIALCSIESVAIGYVTDLTRYLVIVMPVLIAACWVISQVSKQTSFASVATEEVLALRNETSCNDTSEFNEFRAETTHESK